MEACILEQTLIQLVCDAAANSHSIQGGGVELWKISRIVGLWTWHLCIVISGNIASHFRYRLGLRKRYNVILIHTPYNLPLHIVGHHIANGHVMKLLKVVPAIIQSVFGLEQVVYLRDYFSWMPVLPISTFLLAVFVVIVIINYMCLCLCLGPVPVLLPCSVRVSWIIWSLHINLLRANAVFTTLSSQNVPTARRQSVILWENY